MSDHDQPTTRQLQEEIRQLRAAVSQLTVLTHAMYQQMVRHDLVPVPEFSRWASRLTPAVLDGEVRAHWDGANEALGPYLAEAAERQHPD